MLHDIWPKMPEFYMIIARKIFFRFLFFFLGGGGERASMLPVSHAYGDSTAELSSIYTHLYSTVCSTASHPSTCRPCANHAVSENIGRRSLRSAARGESDLAVPIKVGQRITVHAALLWLDIANFPQKNYH